MLKDYWTMKDGKRVKYTDMTDSHINNCIRLIDTKLKESKREEQIELNLFPVFDILDGNADVQLCISQEYEDRRRYMLEEKNRLNVELLRRQRRGHVTIAVSCGYSDYRPLFS